MLDPILVVARARYLSPLVEELSFTDHKIAFLSGPRQCGKTTMAKSMLAKRGVGEYFNWDETEFRRLWAKTPAAVTRSLDAGVTTPLIVLDEIRKGRLWKRTLKGVYDTQARPVDFLVTGSARLAIYRRGSDSLLGRYRAFRLHPFSLAELRSPRPPTPEAAQEALFRQPPKRSKTASRRLEDLYTFGPFPEPLLARDARRARLWRRTRLDAVVRQDLRDITRISDVGRVEMLAALLPERVASPLSIASLREIIEVSHDTLKRWLAALREVYYCFEVRPYAKRIARTLKKEPKVYLWDFSEVTEEAARFENLVACHLLKAAHYWTDAGYGEFELRYLRNKDKKEIDFLITCDGAPWLPVEVKLSDDRPSRNWRTFLPRLGVTDALQVVREPGVRTVSEIAETKVHIQSAEHALDCLV